MFVEAAALVLHLACQGGGERVVRNTTNGYAYDSSGNSVYGSASRSSRRDFADQLDIEIDGSGGKVRLPRRFLPAISGGSGGWYEIKKLAVSEDRISGFVALNFLNHTRINIDRRTGVVSMDNSQASFTGQCQAYGDASRPRAF